MNVIRQDIIDTIGLNRTKIGLKFKILTEVKA